MKELLRQVYITSRRTVLYQVAGHLGSSQSHRTEDLEGLCLFLELAVFYRG